MALLCVVPAIGFTTHAQDRSGLIRRLGDRRTDFRLRVQAAFTLGNLGDEAAVPALGRALRDSNPAVRAAAAAALGRIGSRRALPALRRAADDSSSAVRIQVQRSIRTIEESSSEEEPPPRRRASRDRARPTRGIGPDISIMPRETQIPWPRVRWVVTLGDMENRAEFGDDELASLLRSEVTRQLNVMRGIAVMRSPIHIDERARREMRRRRLPNLRLDGNIAEVQRSRRGRDVSVRCEVSLMILDHEQRSIRGELRGAATGSEPRRRDRREQEMRLAEQAVAGAVRSAMSNARTALAQAARR